MTRYRQYIVCILLCAGSSGIRAQDPEIDSLKKVLVLAVPDSTRLNTLLALSTRYASFSPDEAINYGIQARSLSIKLGNRSAQAYALKNIGLGYYKQDKYNEALVEWNNALAIFESIHDESGVANLLNNLGTVNYNQRNDVMALDNYLKSLQISEKIGNKYRMATALQNVGSVYMNKKQTHEEALGYFYRALDIGEKEGYEDVVGAATVNMGELYFEKGFVDSALFYFQKSLKVLNESGDTSNIPYTLNDIGKVYTSRKDFENARLYHGQALIIGKKINSQLAMAQSLLGLAKTYEVEGHYGEAIKYYRESEQIASTINLKQELKESYQGLADAYLKERDYRNAFQYQSLLTSIKDSIYNSESDQTMASLRTNYEIQKKQGEINLLVKDKALQDSEIKKQKIAKDSLIAGLALIFIIAFIIYRGYRNKVRTNRILDKQKLEIEGLLLNILPAEVAEELQRKGKATPRYYDQVSVLFTDFKGFTRHADALSPQEIVSELNTCFMAFDDIIEQYGLEKIKTIGDSYMCAGGIPTQHPDHLTDLMKAAFGIRNYMAARNIQRMNAGQPAWDLRIGVHVGPLVAGVVGRKKYAYDIWGSTVNIASRMESNGEPGQINVSDSVYKLIRDLYDCRHRGKIFAKNIGEIDMYFVEEIQLPRLEDLKADIVQKRVLQPFADQQLLKEAAPKTEG